MALVIANPAVGTTPVRLDHGATDYGQGHSIAINNTGAVTVWIGGDNTVTAANSGGYPLAAGDKFADDLKSSDQVWAVATGATSVNTIQSGA